METIATDLAKSNLEKLINAILEQSRYICCFPCITEEFEKERENLIAKKETLEEYVRVANRRTDNIRRDVTVWQRQAKELIEEDTKMKVMCFFGWCPNCKWQYSRGKELESKTEEIKRLLKCNFENVGITRDVPGIEYHSSHNYISFKSRKLKFEELFNALTADNNYMIGLQGMAGTGKTTLAKEMGKQLKQSNIFDQVVDTTVSNTPDTKKIQDDIAAPLGLPLKDFIESERPRRLWNRLTNGEKILVILDDVWGDINFEEIGIPFKDSHNGCRVLVTSRNMSTCHKMDCEKMIQLDILPSEDGWILFQKHAGLSDTSPKSVIAKGRKISEECKGLPIAISVIAGSLKGKRHLEEWDVALKFLQKSMLIRGDDENWNKVYTCLRYSYDNMKNKIAKKLFLLCSLFREDEEISEELLVRLAIGAGLIEKVDDDCSYDECRMEVIVAKYELIDSCLLLSCGSRRVKMHDLVREMALSIANMEILAVNTSNKNELTMVQKEKNIKYLLCECKDTDLFSLKFDGSKLNILILYWNKKEDYVEIPNTFFENIPRLQVLYVSNIISKYENPFLLLPQSIRLLTNIRSLYLEGFMLGDISTLGILKGLQTLELIRCLFDNLPREITKLGKLKLLKLDECHFPRNNSFEVIESCTSLEELHFIHFDISKNSHNVTLPNYQRFCILDCYSFLISKELFVRNSLKMFMADEVFSKETFKYLAKKAEVLHLNGLGGFWNNLIPQIIFLDGEGTCNLVELEMNDISQLRCIVDNTSSRLQRVLSMLVSLKLRNMKSLKEICSGPLPYELLKSLESFTLQNCIHFEGTLFKSKISISYLTSLFITGCPMLTHLFEFSTTQGLVLLKRLTVMDCEQLKSIIRDDICDARNYSKSFISTFPNLILLHIFDCPQLDFIFPMVAVQNVPKLEYLEIRHCNEVKYLFGSYQHKHEEQDLHQELKDVIFTTLKRVVLEDLPNFVDIFQECDESMFSSVKRSTSKDETKSLKEPNPVKCNILHWIRKYRKKCRTTKIPLESKDQLQDSSSLSMVNDSNANDVIAKEMLVVLINVALNEDSNIFFTLQNVTDLSIQRCQNVEVIFCASALECLPYLHAFGIFGCNELKQIIGDDTKNQREPFFPRLKVLVMRECNKLKCVFPISTSKMAPKLEVLVIVKACMLEEVFQGNSDEKVEIPNLKIAVFAELPSLCQEIEFRTVKHCFVKNCPKLSFSSSLPSFQDIIRSIRGYFQVQGWIFDVLYGTLRNLFEAEKISNQNPRAEIGSEVEAASLEGSELTSSHNNANQSTLATIDEDDNQQHDEDLVKQNKERVEEQQQIVGKSSSMPLSPTDIPLHKTHSPENEEEQMAIPSSNLNTEPPITTDVNDGDFQGTSNKVVTNSQNTNTTGSEVTNQRIKILPEIPDDVDEVVSGNDHTSSQEAKKTYEEGTTSPYAKTIPFSTDSESEHNGEVQISKPFSIVNIELETTEDVGVGDIQEASKSMIARSETKNSPEKLSEITEDSSFAYTVKRELEELVSNKHLGSENLALLTNYLVKHPSVRLTDNALSERYKGFAYTCLVDLLKFLQSHSVFDVLGSNHSEFVGLLKVLRNFGFNKDWLDDVERLKVL